MQQQREEAPGQQQAGWQPEVWIRVRVQPPGVLVAVIITGLGPRLFDPSGANFFEP